jgi:phospholipase A1
VLACLRVVLRRQFPRCKHLAWALPFWLPAAALAVDLAALAHCRAIADPTLRLACYDAASGEPALSETAGKLAPAPRPEGPAPADSGRSLIADRWGLGAPPEDSRFDLRPHRQSYLLIGRFSDSPNRAPVTPSKPPLAMPLDIQASEAKFQVSFKLKLADFGRDVGMPLSVWVAYTQQSHWQVFNGRNSRPFRETNYEPEVMVATHPDWTFGGWRLRLAALGFSHQSNGRAEPLSRSWNRIVGQFGVEKGDVAVILRPWLRLREAEVSDDNPDIVDYLGHGEVTLLWAPGRHQLSLTTRLNLATGRSAAQAQWTFPMARRVRGMVQLFSGYGESLVDYNRRQNTLGIGISLADQL